MTNYKTGLEVRNDCLHLIIGNPKNRRVQMFQNALSDLDGTSAIVVPWIDYLQNDGCLESLLHPGMIIRIESPGDDFDVERELIAAGHGLSQEGTCLSPAAARNLLYEKGRILYPNQWYQGFCSVLKRVETILSEYRCTAMNSPSDIASMFNKAETYRLFKENAIPVPASPGPVSCYDELREVMANSGMKRVFVKLSCGSSASGVVAYELSKQGEQAHTSVELITGRSEPVLFNSLLVRKYRDPSDIQTIIDWLCREGAHVEEWIPKSGFHGKSYDIRMLVVNGQAAHRIVRMGSTPMTNLHLGNSRYDFNDLGLSKTTVAVIAGTAERAASLFNDSLYTGIDLALPAGSMKPVLFEANAFGDLLPGLKWKGMDTYSSELEALRVESVNGNAENQAKIRERRSLTG